MSAMADKDGRVAARTGREGIQKLAQAALNADVTVGQVDSVLSGLSETLVDLNNSTANLDATLERFNDTISRIDELAPRLISVVDASRRSSIASNALPASVRRRSRRWPRPRPRCAAG